MSNEDMSGLIHVGFTNKYQLDYANEAEGAFYADSDNECYIPLYMLKAHSMRAPDSVVVETHEAMVLRVKELEGALLKIIELDEAVHCFEDGETLICSIAAKALEQSK